MAGGLEGAGALRLNALNARVAGGRSVGACVGVAAWQVAAGERRRVATCLLPGVGQARGGYRVVVGLVAVERAPSVRRTVACRRGRPLVNRCLGGRGRLPVVGRLMMVDSAGPRRDGGQLAVARLAQALRPMVAADLVRRALVVVRAVVDCGWRRDLLLLLMAGPDRLVVLVGQGLMAGSLLAVDLEGGWVRRWRRRRRAAGRRGDGRELVELVAGGEGARDAAHQIGALARVLLRAHAAASGGRRALGQLPELAVHGQPKLGSGACSEFFRWLTSFRDFASRFHSGAAGTAPDFRLVFN